MKIYSRLSDFKNNSSAAELTVIRYCYMKLYTLNKVIIVLVIINLTKVYCQSFLKISQQNILNLINNSNFNLFNELDFNS